MAKTKAAAVYSSWAHQEIVHLLRAWRDVVHGPECIPNLSSNTFYERLFESFQALCAHDETASATLKAMSANQSLQVVMAKKRALQNGFQWNFEMNASSGRDWFSIPEEERKVLQTNFGLTHKRSIIDEDVYDAIEVIAQPQPSSLGFATGSSSPSTSPVGGFGQVHPGLVPLGVKKSVDGRNRGDPDETSKAGELSDNAEKLQNTERRSPVCSAKPRGGKCEYSLKVVVESSESDSSDNENNNTEWDATSMSGSGSKNSAHSLKLKDDNTTSVPDHKDNSPRVVKKRRVRESTAVATMTSVQMAAIVAVLEKQSKHFNALLSELVYKKKRQREQRKQDRDNWQRECEEHRQDRDEAQRTR